MIVAITFFTLGYLTCEYFNNKSVWDAKIKEFIKNLRDKNEN